MIWSSDFIGGYLLEPSKQVMRASLSGSTKNTRDRRGTLRLSSLSGIRTLWTYIQKKKGKKFKILTRVPRDRNFACVWSTALKLGCITNLDMLFLVMGFISLVDEIHYMLISSRHICIRSIDFFLNLNYPQINKVGTCDHVVIVGLVWWLYEVIFQNSVKWKLLMSTF